MKRYNNNYIEVLFFGAFGDLVTDVTTKHAYVVKIEKALDVLYKR
jgi:hypothetical protein